MKNRLKIFKKPIKNDLKVFLIKTKMGVNTVKTELFLADNSLEAIKLAQEANKKKFPNTNLTARIIGISTTKALKGRLKLD